MDLVAYLVAGQRHVRDGRDNVRLDCYHTWMDPVMHLSEIVD